jgi:hypothetical protein
MPNIIKPVYQMALATSSGNEHPEDARLLDHDLSRVSSARLTSAAPTDAAYVPTVQRIAWLNKTTYY